MEARKINIGTNEYPENLRNIKSPPGEIYVNGDILPSDVNAVAIVGTRRATYYGLEQCEKLSYDLAIRGITVVSGMARGIDSAAHRGALKAGGRTIAVLGSGHDNIYPPENRKLYNEIIKSGAVVSEFPMETAPHAANFPQRNRVISGLSLGVLVAEAPRNSGAIITAHQALDQNRNVYTIPGRIDMPSFSGNHYLLKQGAKLVEGVDDILSEFEFLFPEAKAQIFGPDREKAILAKLSSDEKKVYQLLSTEETGINDIGNKAKLPQGRVLHALLKLEMDKLVKQLPGKQFVRVSR